MENASIIDASLEKEIFRLNRLDYLCDKHGLEWPVKGWKLHLMNLVRLLFRLVDGEGKRQRGAFPPFLSLRPPATGFFGWVAEETAIQESLPNGRFFSIPPFWGGQPVKER